MTDPSSGVRAALEQALAELRALVAGRRTPDGFWLALADPKLTYAVDRLLKIPSVEAALAAVPAERGESVRCSGARE